MYVQLVTMAPRVDGHGRGRGRGAAHPHVDEPIIEDFVLEEVEPEEPVPHVAPAQPGVDLQVPPPPLGFDAAGLTQILQAACDMQRQALEGGLGRRADDAEQRDAGRVDWFKRFQQSTAPLFRGRASYDIE